MIFMSSSYLSFWSYFGKIMKRRNKLEKYRDKTRILRNQGIYEEVQKLCQGSKNKEMWDKEILAPWLRCSTPARLLESIREREKSRNVKLTIQEIHLDDISLFLSFTHIHTHSLTLRLVSSRFFFSFSFYFFLFFQIVTRTF